MGVFVKFQQGEVSQIKGNHGINYRCQFVYRHNALSPFLSGFALQGISHFYMSGSNLLDPTPAKYSTTNKSSLWN